MSKAPFRSKFNWAVKEGDSTRQISYNIQANETSNTIPQEKLLNPDACLVLEPNSDREPCEQSISVNPMYQVIKLAILAECSRIESYVGKIPEYNQTHSGQLVFADGSQLYRFDVQFEVCGTAEFILRYISPRNEQLCLYGLHLVLEKNSNPLGMFASDSTLNRAMIDLRVDDSKLSERAARCKEFLLSTMTSSSNNLSKYKSFQNILNYNIANAVSVASGSTSGTGSNVSRPTPQTTGADPGGTSSAPRGPSLSEAVAKQYIDGKFAALEAKIDARLEALESRQNQKLDEMLALLKSISMK
ncbi:uncharacterized protein LOC135704000 [Ochlerotatus camptorhynchus]|uniref:uncharacterized protein LOC135704000 n=1 Tax=Ochlerotatus camptorhynchus TaxID=644619 RepID=UPI0031CF3227